MPGPRNKYPNICRVFLGAQLYNASILTDYAKLDNNIKVWYNRNMNTFESFRPQPELQIDIHDQLFDAHVEAVNEHLSRRGAQYFIDAANNAQTHEGTKFAVVGGGYDRSADTAILMPGTFANGVWPHLVARAEALSFQAANAGLRDRDGMLIPVVLTASPGMDSRFNLAKKEIQALRGGNFESVASRNTDLVRSVGIEQVSAIVGTSQASVVAAPFAETASGDLIADNFSAVLVEPPHAKNQGVSLLGIRFAREGAKFKEQLQDEDIDVINKLFSSKHAAKDFEKGIWKERKENLAFIRGFTKGKLARDLINLALHGIDTTVIVGTDSQVAPRLEVRASYEQAYNQHSAYNASFLDASKLRLLEISGTNHSFGDRVGRFATAVAANLAD